MPTVIDELIVKLGLDGSEFKGEQDAIRASFRQVTADAQRSGEEMESHGRQGAEFFNQLKSAALGLAAVLGFKELEGLARRSTEASAEVGRLAQNLEMSTQQLSEWEAAVEQFAGGTKAGAGASIKAMSDALQEFQLSGTLNSTVQGLQALHVAWLDQSGAMRPILDIYKELADREKGMDRRKAMNINKDLGMDEGTSNLILQGNPEIAAHLTEIRRQGSVSDADAQAAIRLQTAFAGAANSLDTFTRNILTSLGPALSAFFDDVKEVFIALSHNKDIVTALNDVVAGMTASLKSVDWAAFASSIKSVIDYLAYLNGDTQAGDILNGINGAVKSAGDATHGILERIWAWRERAFGSWGGTAQSSADIQAKDVPDVAKALLTAIKRDESAGKYNARYGGAQDATFDDYSHHPGIAVPIPGKPGLTSDAAGAYQFLSSTWRDLQRKHPDLTDFSPAMQDRGAWYLAQDSYKGNLAADLQGGDPAKIAEIIRQLRPIWPSLPGGDQQGAHAQTFGPDLIASLRSIDPHRWIVPATPAAPTPDAAPTPSVQQDLRAQPTPGAQRQSSNTSATTVQIARIDVHTQATDAPGIARSIRDSLHNVFIAPQAATGLS